MKRAALLFGVVAATRLAARTSDALEQRTKALDLLRRAERVFEHKVGGKVGTWFRDADAALDAGNGGK